MLQIASAEELCRSCRGRRSWQLCSVRAARWRYPLRPRLGARKARLGAAAPCGSARGNACARSSLSRLRVRVQILEMEMIRSEYPVPLRKFIETPAEITCGNCMGKVKKKTTRLERTYKDCHSTCQMLRAVAQVYWAGSNPASERSGAGRECCTGEAVRVLGVHVGTLSMSLHRVGGSRAGQDQTNEWPASTARARLN